MGKLKKEDVKKQKAEYMRNYYATHPEYRLRLIENQKQKYDKNPNKYRKKTRDFNKKHPEKKKEWDRNWKLKNHGYYTDYLKEYRNGPKRDELLQKKKQHYIYLKKHNPELLHRLDVKQAEERWKLKEEVLLMYSPEGSTYPKCCCCGEWIIEFLSLDHIEGSGGSEESIPSHSFSPYPRWVKANKPKYLQTLCMNCNFGRNLTPDKICPHKFMP